MKKNKSKIFTLVIVIFISVIITICLCGAGFIWYFNHYMKNLKVELTKTETIEKVTVTDSGIADAVEKVYDSVGAIENYKGGNLYSTGSGFIFKVDDEKGYILTNHHVIDSSSELFFVLTSGEKVKVEIVGSDEYADIAVLSIDKDKVIDISQIGNSNNTRVGDTVFTVGAPVDSTVYYQTVTRGILSGKDRIIEIENSGVMEALQTDAAINSGNSGGPLCNSNGEVIGINSMKLASSSIEGMGFAIPIEIALEYANAFISGEEIKRPYLGVYTYNSYYTSGIYIHSVEKNSPAEKAGLQKGDLILKINDVEIENSAYLKYELYKYKIGDTIKVEYKRDGKTSIVEIILSEY